MWGNMGARKMVEETEPVVKKIERTPEEKEALKRELLLNINAYHIGSYKEAPLDKLHNHIFQADGDYLVVNNKIGRFIVKVAEANRPGLPQELSGNKIELKVPKIPSKIYYEIVAFFRDICDTMGGAEAFIQVYYDKKDKKYVCHVPEQTVTGTSVRYDATENLNEKDRERYIFVFEVHSHNNMSAFWSGTDNADEKETKFYGVFGKIKEDVIEEKFRFMVMGKQIDLQKEHIFDFPKETEFSTQEILNYLTNLKTPVCNLPSVLKQLRGDTGVYPKEWKEKVKKPVYQTNTFKKDDDDDRSYFRQSHRGQWDGWGDEDERYYGNSWGRGSYRGKDVDEDYMTQYSSDTPPMKDLADIDDIFDINHYEEELHGIIIETFVSNLDPNQATLLMESLVEFGHDGLLQQFRRR